MLLLWILLLLLISVIIKYVYLILKRLVLVFKLKRTQSVKLFFQRNLLKSVFAPDGKVDFIVNRNDKDYHVSVITTPFRRVRYHFDKETLQIVFERRAVNLTNFSSPRPHAATTVDTAFVLKKYKLFYSSDIPEKAARYIILHPAPKSVSAVSGTQLVAVDNNDLLYGSIKVCGLKYFLNNVISEQT